MASPKSNQELERFEVIKLEENHDVQGLIGVLCHSQNKNTVKQAIYALGELKDPRAIEPLVEKGLKSPLISLKSATVHALVEIDGGDVVQPLIFVMLKEKDIRAEVAEALGKLRAPSAVDALAFVMTDEEEDELVREKALQALGDIATEQAIAGVVSMLATSLGEKASMVLKELGSRATMSLIVALGDQNQTVREQAVTTLGEIGDRRAVEPLIALLMDEKADGYFRGTYVATALGKIRDERAVTPLLELASKHAEDILTCMSVEALGDIGDNRAVEPLIAILEDNRTSECSHLRLEACWALGKMPDARAIESLVKILENPREAEYGGVDASASALIEIDEDRIELPLLKYFSNKLAVLLESESSLGDQREELLQNISRLLRRLMTHY